MKINRKKVVGDTEEWKKIIEPAQIEL
jgi:hypothetical protein